MAASITLYDSWVQKMLEATNLATPDTFKVGLTTSTYSPNATTHDELADITNELSGNGYARQTMTLNLSRSGGTYTFDASDVVFTATGGSLVARYAFIYNDTPTGDPLVAYVLLDTTPADITVTDGNTLTLVWNASGIFTVAKV